MLSIPRCRLYSNTVFQFQSVKSKSGESAPPSKSTATAVSKPKSAGSAARKPRRRTIPERPNYSLNLWSVMKNCVGRDLSKIPMPVSMSE